MLLAEFADQGADFADLDRVKTDCGFIENHHCGRMDDRLRDTDALSYNFV